MSTELSNGVIIPEEYSDDWYDEMSINLRKLNDVITAASDNATDIQRLDTDKANQSDLTALTSRVSQNETDITALQTAVSGALKREIVQTLPTEDISTTTIYMIRNSQSSGTNIYDEYMYINSQWELIGTSATDFSNYYTKTENDNLLSAKANQTDLTALSGRVTQNETDITALQTAVSGALKREIVQTLPTEDISTTTIYMIRNSQSSGTNIYDEYMYINSQWELIGTSATDFSNYYTKTEIDTLLSYKATDSDVVHKSGNETVGGEKTFPDYSFSNSGYGFIGQGNRTSYILPEFTGGYSGLSIVTPDFNKSVKIGIHTTDENTGKKVLNTISGYLQISTGSLNGVNTVSITPINTVNSNLGTVNNNWKTFNGLTPSSLGMPNYQAGKVDISAYITDLSGVNNNYTAPANGYVFIRTTNGTYLKLLEYSSGVGSTVCSQIADDIGTFIPVLSGRICIIAVKCSSIDRAYFIPCLGNI